MDGYLGRSLDDFTVPKYQESSVAFAAPDIWGRWSMSSPEAPEDCFIMDHYDAMNHGFSGGLYDQIKTGSIEESKKLNACGDLSSDSWLQGVKDDHHQLHDFNGIEQMDDIFLSILEDVPGSWSLHSPSDHSLKPMDNVSSGEDVSVPPFVPCNSGPCHGMPLDIEEGVLQDLQRATEKLTDETRICFRDTFYRLAKNSLQDQVASSSTNPEDCHMQAPCSLRCDQVDGTRSRRNPETETETNSIDRAVANLTFNKMEYNIEMFPLSERGSAVHASEGCSRRRTHYQQVLDPRG